MGYQDFVVYLVLQALNFHESEGKASSLKVEKYEAVVLRFLFGVNLQLAEDFRLHCHHRPMHVVISIVLRTAEDLRVKHAHSHVRVLALHFEEHSADRLNIGVIESED